MCILVGGGHEGRRTTDSQCFRPGSSVNRCPPHETPRWVDVHAEMGRTVCHCATSRTGEGPRTRRNSQQYSPIRKHQPKQLSKDSGSRHHWHLPSTIRAADSSVMFFFGTSTIPHSRCVTASRKGGGGTLLHPKHRGQQIGQLHPLGPTVSGVGDPL